MAVSHFIITKLPQDVISKIGVSNITLNQQYAIALESTLNFERIPALDGYFLTDKVKFKAYDDTLEKYGNEASLDLLWKEYDLANLPTSSDVTETWTKGQTGNMLASLPINQAVEFVEVVSIDGVRNLNLNGKAVLQGHQLSPRNLLYAIYTSHLQGGGFPYFTLQYQAGRSGVLEPTVYSFTINIASIAEMVKTEDSVINSQVTIIDQSVHERYTQVGVFEVTEGYAFGTAEIQVNIQCPFLSQGNLELQSEVLILVNGIETLFTADAIVPIVLNLDQYGKGKVTITHDVLKENATETGTTTLTLQSINSDVNAVSGTLNTATLDSTF